jgi:hypothetical protein
MAMPSGNDDFDREVDEFLRRPEVSASLDELHRRLDRGEVELVDLDTACARIEQRRSESSSSNGPAGPQTPR